jgi:Mce-associated membrane protein
MEGDAGASQLNPTAEAIEPPTESVETEATDEDSGASSEVADVEGGPERRQEHFGRGWLVAICAAIVLASAGVAAGGYLALKGHDRSAAVDRDEAIAVARAKECVAATQAPDVAAITQSQTKIIECGTGDFAVQSSLYAGMLVDAYQAANVSVKVADLRAAAERSNDDGSVDVLVAVRVRVTNTQVSDQEQGYRLRVKMAPADGTYNISNLDQVTS